MLLNFNLFFNFTYYYYTFRISYYIIVSEQTWNFLMLKATSGWKHEVPLIGSWLASRPLVGSWGKGCDGLLMTKARFSMIWAISRAACSRPVASSICNTVFVARYGGTLCMS